MSAACQDVSEHSLVETARLLTSELVTNALQHGTGTIQLRVRCSPDQVLVEVFDEGKAEPHLLALEPERTGKGLHIVEELAHQWGVTHYSNAKSVWFVVRP